MNNYESPSHTRWECKYHIVFIPKYRRKSLYGELRKHSGEMFHELARQRKSNKDEAMIRKYIQEQEKEDQRLDQLEMFKG